MGKTGKWIRSFLTGKKEKEKQDKEKCHSDHHYHNHHLPSLVVTENPTTPVIFPPTTPKEKRRWSFRRSSASAASAPKELSNSEGTVATTPGAVALFDGENEQKKHAMAVAAATAAAADAAVAAAQAAAAMIRLASAANGRTNAVEEAAATKIQAVFRSYLARKALRALRGLVKLQALVRGHLVRKQAKATLRCMQALLNVQAKVRAQRILLAEDGRPPNHRQSPHRRSIQDNKNRHTYKDSDRGEEENIKIVEMDYSEPKLSSRNRKSYSNHSPIENGEHRFSEYYPANNCYSKQDGYQISPAPSALTDMSPRLCSGHFEEYNSFNTAESSPQCFSAISKPPPSEYAESLNYDYAFYPNYMANTESSRAKARSQSAPKSRPDSYERQPSRRKLSLEGRNVPRVVRMQRSSSHVGSTIQGYQYPWSIKLGRSTVSVKDSECGSTSTILTNTNYCRSLAGYELQSNGIKY